MSISRRLFLKSGLATVLTTQSPGLLRLAIPSAAATDVTDYRAAVCVFLSGGNDGCNCCVPLDAIGYQQYASSRGELALPQGSLLPVQTHASATPYGFHAQLPGLRGLFEQSRLAVLANVGTLVAPITREQYLARTISAPHNLFSHSDQTRQWQSSQASRLSGNSLGWGGLMADALQSHNSAAIYPIVTSMAGTSLYCEGGATYPSIVNPSTHDGLKGFGTSATSQLRMQGMRQLIDSLSGHTLIDTAAGNSRRMFDELDALNSMLASYPALQTAFPDTSIGKQFRSVAEMIQAHDGLGIGRQLFFVSFAGFDTHSNQLATQAALLAQLDAAMTAFYLSTQELGIAEQVLTFTMSEFGRTLLPSNGGSDHGWGNHQFIMGGAVQGGDIYGTVPSLELGGSDDAKDRGRLIPTTSVDQYAATIASWLGVSDPDILNIFPQLANFQTQRLAFV